MRSELLDIEEKHLYEIKMLKQKLKVILVVLYFSNQNQCILLLNYPFIKLFPPHVKYTIIAN